MPGAEHRANTGHPGRRRRVDRSCFIVAMHYVRPDALKFSIQPPDERTGSGGAVHKDRKPICVELLGQSPAFEQAMHRNLVSGSSLQTAERSHHGLGAADLHAVDHVSDSHFFPVSPPSQR